MRMEQLADNEDPVIGQQETTLDSEPPSFGSACCLCETGLAHDTIIRVQAQSYSSLAILPLKRCLLLPVVAFGLRLK